MLRLRVMTAIVLAVALSVAIVFLPPLGFSVLIGAVLALAGWEWANLSGVSSALGKATYVLLLSLALVFFVIYSDFFAELPKWSRVQDVLGLACLWWAIALLWVKTYPGSAVFWGSAPARLVIGLLVLLPAWVALVYLRLLEHGSALIFVLVGIVTSADIGAYFSGKAWGKAKLAPAVSPGKSMAGFWGGLAASSALVLVLWCVFDESGFSWLTAIGIAVVSSLASVLGDLLESMIKRHRGIKDSGAILPGHGGIMDRIDGFTAAAPVFALCLMLVGK